MHSDNRSPQHGGLRGALPYALVRGEEVQLQVSRQVYGAKVIGSNGQRGAAGNPGQGRPLGAYFMTPGGGVVVAPVVVETMVNSNCTLDEVIIVTKGGVGSCQLALWKSNLVTGHYPPLSSDDITGGANVVLTSGTTYRDATLSGYTTALLKNDIILISLLSSTNFTSIAVYLVTR